MSKKDKKSIVGEFNASLTGVLVSSRKGNMQKPSNLANGIIKTKVNEGGGI